MTTNDHHNHNTIGRQLRAARRAAGLTQGALAARMGISQTEVSRLEHDAERDYRIATLRRYVAALGTGRRLEIRIVDDSPPAGAGDDRRPDRVST